MTSQSNPTEQIVLDPKVKNVAFDWFISNADGYEYPCSIHYEIDERTKEVFSYGVSFHIGFDNPKDGFKYVKEILQDIVKDLEGKGLEFLQEPVIE